MSDIEYTSHFIPTSKIQIITITVTEKINKKFLQDFITTALEQNNILIDDNTYIYSNFIEEINIYEIYIINSTKTNFNIYPDIFYHFYENIKALENIDLFIAKDFFTIFKYGKLYCFKSFKNSLNEDIQNYVIQTYKLSIDNIHIINNNEFNQLQKLYLKNEKYKTDFFKLKKPKSFLFFTIFSFICLVIFTNFTYNSYINISKNKENRLSILKEKYNRENSKKVSYKKITPKLLEVFKHIKLKNLLVDKITYESNKIQLSIFHKDKNRLLDFLTTYNEKIIIENIQFLQEQSLYQMVVKIEI